ncbi:MAG: CbiQ family ECF transporter T component [Candidatus Nanopelagicales bacterium]
MSLPVTFAPRLLHPGAWWVWALGLATAAARTTNPLLLVLIAVAAGVVVAERRVPGPWSRSYTAFLWLGLTVIAVRMLFQILFGSTDFGVVLVTFPEMPLPAWLAGVRLGGPLTADGLLLALFEGLRLATILICVGAANSLVNPSRLLRLVPAALYEAGVAVVVCMSVTPILITDAARIRRARRLRGRTTRGPRAWGQIALPLFTGALERSVALAASMDARGYGRAGGQPPRVRRLNSTLVVAGLVGVTVGLYGLLEGGDPGVAGGGLIGWPMLVAGAALAAAGSLVAGRQVTRTHYRPDPWGLPEWLVAACGVIPATVFVLTTPDSLVGPASPPGWPTLPLLPALSVAVAALPAVLAPRVPGVRPQVSPAVAVPV